MKLDIDALGLRGKRILCAVSGGADSVALLRLLCEARDNGGIVLFAAHFEHGIRGEASVKDMEFVKELCESLKVPLEIGRGDVPGESEKTGEGLEACARRLRHEFLESVRVSKYCDLTALAHHRRDRAETVLMHILRGGGMNGVAAMSRISGQLVRPLIDIPPEALRDYLTEIGQPWREDETNLVDDNPRNALRLNVLGEIRKIYPGGEEALCRFADIAYAENALVVRLTDEFMAGSVTSRAGIYMLPAAADLALMRRALKRIIPDSSFETVERARTAVGRTELPGGYSACRVNGVIYVSAPVNAPDEAEVNLCGLTVLDGIGALHAKSCRLPPVKNNGFTQVLARSALTGSVLRLRKNGDRIAPFGMGGRHRLLSDYLDSRRVPLPLRSRLAVIAKGSDVIWVPGVGIAEEAAAIEGGDNIKTEFNYLGGKL